MGGAGVGGEDRNGDRQETDPERGPARSRGRDGAGDAASRVPRHAAAPPLRGEGQPALRHGAHWRLLPPLYRAGGGGHRHPVRARAGRFGHHRLSLPRPHADRGRAAQGGHGGAYRARRRLLQGQGRLDAPVRARARLLWRPRHRRRPGAARRRPRLRPQVPRLGPHLRHLFRRRRRQSGPGVRGLQHGGALAAPRPLRDREQPVRHGHGGGALGGGVGALRARRGLRHSRRAGRRDGRRGGLPCDAGGRRGLAGRATGLCSSK